MGVVESWRFSDRPSGSGDVKGAALAISSRCVNFHFSISNVLASQPGLLALSVRDNPHLASAHALERKHPGLFPSLLCYMCYLLLQDRRLFRTSDSLA